MPKPKKEDDRHSGNRIAELRKRAGFTQVELAEELGVSQRVISYYEAETEHPPTHLLAQIAKALKVSADELLGTAPLKKEIKPRNTRLERRLQQIEQLGAKEKRQVMQFLDTVIEHEKLRRKVGS